jgi:PAS domain-containing protein
MAMTMEESLTPESYQKALKRIGLLVDSPETVNKNLEIIELQQFHANGRLLDVEIAARLIRDADGTPRSLAGVTRDITARKIAERKLQEEKDKFRSLFEHITDYVLILKAQDEDLVITDMSESAC